MITLSFRVFYFTSGSVDELLYQELVSSVQLPSSSWNWSYSKQTKTAVCVGVLHYPDGDLLLKAMRVLSSSQVSFQVGGIRISLPNTNGSYSHCDQLSSFLETLNRHNPCRGILNSLFANVNVTGKCSVEKHGDVWRSTSCSHLASPNSRSELCTRCTSALKYLRQRANKPKNVAITKQKLKVANQKVKRMQTREMVNIGYQRLI